MPSDLIKIGSFGPAHGVRGQILLRSFTDSPKDILKFPLTDASGAKKYAVKLDGVKGDDLIVTLEGMTDRNEAEKLKNVPVFAPAEALPPKEDGTWYHSELIGMQAVTEDGKPYGKVLGVHNFGAGDILEFELPDGKNEMLPFKDAFIGPVDEKTKTLTVFPPDYLEAKD